MKTASQGPGVPVCALGCRITQTFSKDTGEADGFEINCIKHKDCRTTRKFHTWGGADKLERMAKYFHNIMGSFHNIFMFFRAVLSRDAAKHRESWSRLREFDELPSFEELEKRPFKEPGVCCFWQVKKEWPIIH